MAISKTDQTQGKCFKVQFPFTELQDNQRFLESLGERIKPNEPIEHFGTNTILLTDLFYSIPNHIL